MTWASTFRRPRCAIPRNTCRAPRRPAPPMIPRIMGTSMSSPSTEKRFFPR